MKRMKPRITKQSRRNRERSRQVKLARRAHRKSLAPAVGPRDELLDHNQDR